MPNQQSEYLSALFEEVVAFYQSLTRTATVIHGRGPLSGPRRTVLISLTTLGPQTVSGLARARGQSRQRFQPLVNNLLGEGLVEAKANPLHKNAPLIALTAKGERAVSAIKKREAALLARLRPGVPARQLKTATRVMTTVRATLESQVSSLVKESGR